MIELWREASVRHDVPAVLDGGYGCFAHVIFEHPEAQAIRTYYTQEMLARGFLAGPSIYPTLAHNEGHVAEYGKAIDEVFGLIGKALAAGDLAKRLKGPIAHAHFGRLN